MFVYVCIYCDLFRLVSFYSFLSPVLPVFLCGIPMGTVGIVSESFVEDLGHPN